MTNLTEHGKERAADRLKTYLELLGKKPIVAVKEVDKNHKNGIERHVIHQNRLVYIYNVRTNKFVTVLYARDGQLKRYGLNPADFDKFVHGLNNI